MKNEILQEVWRNRDEFARENNYDLDAMVAALQDMEKHSLTRIVDRRKQMPTKPIDSKGKNGSVNDTCGVSDNDVNQDTRHLAS